MVSVKKILKRDFAKKWEKTQKGIGVEIDLTPHTYIHKKWCCDSNKCPLGIHLSSYKVVLLYESDEDKWTTNCKGDDFSEGFGHQRYIPQDQFRIEFMFNGKIPEMNWEDFWNKVKEYFNIKKDLDIYEHNEKVIREYEEEVKKLKGNNKKERKTIQNKIDEIKGDNY